MEVEKVKSLLTSLISLLAVCVYAGANTAEIRTARAYSQVAAHSGNEYKIEQNGNGNFGYIDADDDSSDMDVVQNGDDNDATIYMQGDDNVYKITQTGDDKEGIIRAFGDDSEFTITQSGSGEHYAKIYATTSADNNDADITQTGSGDHSMTLNFYTDDYYSYEV